MKRTYKVTVLVDARGDREQDFKEAVQHLRERGLWLDVTTAGVDSCYSLKSRRGARVRLVPKGKSHGSR